MLSEVPEGWTATPFEQLATLQSGFAFKSANFVDDDSAGLPVIRIRDLEKQSPVKFYDGDVPDEYIVEKGDVLIGMDGEFNCVEWRANNGALNQRVLRVYETEKAARKFLLYRLIPILKDLEGKISGTTVKHLSVKHLKALSIPTPPLNEQHRIAEVLSSVDASIQATQAVIEQAERVKRGLMEELLTGGVGSEAIERGEVPEGWLSLKAVDIAETAGLQTGPFGSQLKAGEYLEDIEPEAVCVVMPKDILFSSINFETAAMISGERAVPLEKHRLRLGDALFARRGDLSKVAVYDDDTVPAICGTGCLRLRPSPDLVDFRFLAFLISSESSIEWLKRNAVGATMPNLNTEIIGAMPLVLPPLDEQIRIAKILSNANEFISAQKSVVEQKNRIKRGLMDDLLTGKVRTV